MSDLGEGTGQFDEVNLSASVCDRGYCVGDEVGADGSLGREGEDQARELAATGLGEGVDPYPFAQLDEGRRAEFEDVEEKIYDDVIVEELEARHRGEFLRNGQFAACGKAVDEDELQRINSCASDWHEVRGL